MSITVRNYVGVHEYSKLLMYNVGKAADYAPWVCPDSDSVYYDVPTLFLVTAELVESVIVP